MTQRQLHLGLVLPYSATNRAKGRPLCGESGGEFYVALQLREEIYITQSSISKNLNHPPPNFHMSSLSAFQQNFKPPTYVQSS